MAIMNLKACKKRKNSSHTCFHSFMQKLNTSTNKNEVKFLGTSHCWCAVDIFHCIMFYCLHKWNRLQFHWILAWQRLVYQSISFGTLDENPPPKHTWQDTVYVTQVFHRCESTLGSTCNQGARATQGAVHSAHWDWFGKSTASWDAVLGGHLMGLILLGTGG